MTEAVTVRHVRFPGRWEVLYVDGEAVKRGHTVDVGRVLSEVEGHQVEEASSEWRDVDIEGYGPERYEDIPSE